jgi:hypothetical protein
MESKIAVPGISLSTQDFPSLRLSAQGMPGNKDRDEGKCGSNLNYSNIYAFININTFRK